MHVDVQNTRLAKTDAPSRAKCTLARPQVTRRAPPGVGVGESPMCGDLVLP
jgi:hypothetical protein